MSAITKPFVIPAIIQQTLSTFDLDSNHTNSQGFTAKSEKPKADIKSDTPSDAKIEVQPEYDSAALVSLLCETERNLASDLIHLAEARVSDRRRISNLRKLNFGPLACQCHAYSRCISLLSTASR